MDKNFLRLEMHWMDGNCGNMSFKSDDYTKPVRIKRMNAALEFVANLVQLSKAIETGATQKGHFQISNNDPGKSWLLQYNFMQGIVDLVLLFRHVTVSPICHSAFVWGGGAKVFKAGIDRMVQHLPAYNFGFKLSRVAKAVQFW